MAHFSEKDVHLSGINQCQGAVRLCFLISTIASKPTHVRCIITVRNDSRSATIVANMKSTKMVDETLYQTQVEVDITKRVVESLFANQDVYDRLPEDEYDISLHYEIENITPLGRQQPMQDSKAYQVGWEDEYWLMLDSTYDVLLRPSFTPDGDLLFYFIPVPLDTAEYYRSQMGAVTARSDKKILLCYEYPEKAQDNGFIFFKYLIHHYKEKYDVYYIISRTSPDLSNLKEYMAHVIFYKSKDSLQLIEQADILCHTHSPYYCLPLPTKKTEALIDAKVRVFIQHGILASKDVSAIYGKHADHSFTDLFIVSSERERSIVEVDYGYDSNEIVLTGLARFDTLIRQRSKRIKRFLIRKKVLIMPTWRAESWSCTDEQFKETKYYQEYQALLQHAVLRKMQRKRNYTFSFYLHRNFQQFTHLFESDFVNILSQGQHHVRDLLREHGVLVTDYSSVGLDFALMHKKVVYYRPPSILGKDVVDEPNDFLPGPIIRDREELICELHYTRMDAMFKNNLHQVYAFNDQHACHRIHSAVAQRFCS